MILRRWNAASAIALAGILAFGPVVLAQTTAPAVEPVERGVRLPKQSRAGGGAADAELRVYLGENLQPVFETPEFGAEAIVRSGRGAVTVEGWQWHPLTYEMTLSASEGAETMAAIKGAVNGKVSPTEVTLATFGAGETQKWMVLRDAQIAEVHFPSVDVFDRERATLRVSLIGKQVTPESGSMKSKFFGQQSANSTVEGRNFELEIAGLDVTRFISVEPPSVSMGIDPGSMAGGRSRASQPQLSPLSIRVPFSDSKPLWEAVEQGAKQTSYQGALNYIAKNRESALKLQMDGLKITGVSIDGTDDMGKPIVRADFVVGSLRVE